MTGTTFLRLGRRPSGNLPTQMAQHDQLDWQPTRPSCASEHALRGTSRRKGTAWPARPAASTTSLIMWMTFTHNVSDIPLTSFSDVMSSNTHSKYYDYCDRSVLTWHALFGCTSHWMYVTGTYTSNRYKSEWHIRHHILHSTHYDIIMKFGIECIG